MKKLPIGVQTFSELINKDYIYVDKTEYIHTLINTGKTCFLSRPRRFGKSLLVSTLKEIFSGNKELFNGFWIYNSDYDWKKHPIVHIDFSAIGFKEIGLEPAINNELDKIAKTNNFLLTATTPGLKMSELISKISNENQAVILIDEYDKPVIDYLTNIEQAQENREILKNFYSCLKALDAHIRFLFITGVSKFSRVSIFSDLNHLDDITTEEGYATLLGYTEEEIIKSFPDYLEAAEKKLKCSREELILKMRTMYNGYKWNVEKESVYNPFSILKYFKKIEFNNYWFSTGTPTFLVEYLRNHKISVENIVPYEVTDSFFEKFELEQLDIWTMMFQTGYLTLKEKTNENYVLDYPNHEVKESFLKNLLQCYSHATIGPSEQALIKIRKALNNNVLEDMVKQLNILFSTIPYQLFKDQTEFFYHAIIHTVLTLCGVDLQSELQTSTGRIDTVIKNEKYVYVIEFKMGTAEEAMEQIKLKEYDKPWRNDKRTVLRVGMGFDKEKKEIAGWVVEGVGEG